MAAANQYGGAGHGSASGDAACASRTVNAVLAEFDTALEGLTEGEAAARLARSGPNRLPEPRSKSLFEVVAGQFRSPFIYLLLIAAAISFALGHGSDAWFIFIVLASNAAIGSFQEWRAESRARALKSLIPVTASVRRGGVLTRLDARLLVPGDIVEIEGGARIPADLRLAEATGLSVDESLLTGESLAVEKMAEPPAAADAPLGERVTMLHAGTVAERGRGVGIVVATGRLTVIGQLAASLDTEDVPPPLMVRMERFTRDVALVTLVLIAIIGAIEAMRGSPPDQIVLLAVALAVSAIPEGLPVAMTVALSIAMQRMGRRQVIVRHMMAVEGLGSCTLIATDKTGTLTENRLTVERIWIPGLGEVAAGDAASAPVLEAGALASEVAALEGDRLSGDAVDLAFHVAAARHPRRGTAPRPDPLGRVPYEAERRYAAAFHGDGDTIIAYAKGAPETIAMLSDDDGGAALAAARDLSARGFRVIAVAAGQVAATGEAALAGLSLIGLAGLIDPLRAGAAEAVAAAGDAGIRVVMVTGDHPLTALAIARQVGIADDPESVVSGAQLASLGTPAAFDAATAGARVFARIEPLQKLAIVESLKRQGHVVAVTGDGVNDAGALHAADIGVAMGRGGTDIAREAAGLILADDNFSSIVAGIEEGRIAYDNVRKVILLVVSTGAAEILLMLLATLSGLPPPLTAVQLLWLNLVTNGLQDVALAFEKGEAGVLRRRPRPAGAPILDTAMIRAVLVSGAAIGLIAFAFYAGALAAGFSQPVAQGATLWLLVWCENAHCFNCRSETRSVFGIPLSNNPLLVASVAGAQALQMLAPAIPPLRDLLSLDGISLVEGIALSVGGIAVLAVMEIYKRLAAAGAKPA
ncbi:cation-transporting P-type ATPase [Kaistia geumhonensis]|uniref:Calcium-translocating P-type ATPase n=1 Tax=Kaistia geumhonensis TaxID=410839 RepID=A0ABU0M399_9HYPH|nr:cation-transporting P-type ATPase [Kaistia geumhonensis]MCX5479353.1 cation-transporting P-type ATPase [Kaistia geumhonensis]MDQ0515424.1 calcium-translocating P-type ATPase [Kaistia geumhonensis]